MNWTAVSLGIASILGLLALVASLLNGRATRKKLEAEAGHLDNENVVIFADAAKTLLGPLKEQLQDAQAKVKVLGDRVEELTDTVREQERKLRDQALSIEDLVEKLNDANRTADWYKREFDRVTRPPSRGNPP